VKLLVLGGTQFVGRALVEAALTTGREVTLFHRGRTSPGLFPESEHVLGDRDGGLEVLRGREWDACLDVSGYVPRIVRQAVELLHGAVGRYVFVSTVSVYASLAEPAVEGAALETLEDPAVEEVDATTYGGLKVLCEHEVERGFGENGLLVRPGFIVGPHDPTGRFTYWAHRAARGGNVLVPASLDEALQLVDARDLAAFTLRALEDGRSGPFNVTGPVPPIGMSDVLEAAGAGADAVPVDDAFLLERGIDSRALPLWFSGPDMTALMRADVSRALAAGLASGRSPRPCVRPSRRPSRSTGSASLPSAKRRSSRSGVPVSSERARASS
jgi:2'-hydroxyisoflavone reductase